MRHLLLLGLLACGTPPAELEDAQTCETLAADSAPLRMLTRTQVDLSLETLMNVEGTARTRLPRDSTMHGFEGFAESGAMSPLIADGWMRLAEDATEQVDWTALVPCDPASIDRTCAEAFVRDFGRRAWRRPLDEDEALFGPGGLTGRAELWLEPVTAELRETLRQAREALLRGEGMVVELTLSGDEAGRRRQFPPDHPGAHTHAPSPRSPASSARASASRLSGRHAPWPEHCVALRPGPAFGPGVSPSPGQTGSRCSHAAP